MFTLAAAMPTETTQKPLRIVLATRNRGKLGELAALTAALDIVWLSLADLAARGIAEPAEVAETGGSFRANARLKAEAVARATGLYALADDSGLEVTALANAPGVDSAIYAGEPRDDARNNAKLLAELTRVAALTPKARTARFVCTLCLCPPPHNGIINESDILFAEGELRGHITDTPRGTNGFGYDPLFVPSSSSVPNISSVPGHSGTPESNAPARTLAELDPAQKNAISHRARALSSLLTHLRSLARLYGAP